MEDKTSEIIMNGSTSSKSSDTDMSLVTKVRSRVSGLFNSSFSKLFGNQESTYGAVRKRESNEDPPEEQPPFKKARSHGNHLPFNPANNSYGNPNSSNCESVPMFTNFSDTVAGPSGLKKLSNVQKTQSPALSHTELPKWDKYSGSDESTSGYSSVLKASNEKELPQLHTSSLQDNVMRLHTDSALGNSFIGFKSLFDKSTSQRSQKSLFGEKSVSPQAKNASLSARKPSFNSTNFSDRSVSISKIINSPFYNGPTIYGGSSAYGREQRKIELKRDQFSIKSFNTSSESNPYASLSKTARRILNTLEQYSTPIGDAKKIPLPTKVDNQKGICSKYVGAKPYSLKKNRIGSDKELIVPSVSELLTLKQKQRLQFTTDEIRHIGSSSTSPITTENYITGEANQRKHSNKLRAKITSIRTKAPVVHAPENVLKSVPLTLLESKLPKFDLMIPPPDYLNNSKKEGIRICSENKSSPAKISDDVKDFLMEFTFSKPVVISDNLESLVAINNFKFSEPLSKKYGFSDIEDTLLKSSQSNSQSEQKALNECLTNYIQPTESNKYPINSIAEERLKPALDTWQCIACENLKSKQISNVEKHRSSDSYTKSEDSAMRIKHKIESEKCITCCVPKQMLNSSGSDPIGNQIFSNEFKCKSCSEILESSSSKCLKCETKREKTQQEYVEFGNKFKPALGTWECQTCLVRNQPDVDVCIACETKRDIRTNVKQHVVPTKPASSTWKCDTCWIMNKAELAACAACETPRQGAIPPAASNKISEKWECPTCMVRNNNDVDKCPCCETLRPNVTLINKNTVAMFNFGINKAQFNFGLSKNNSELNQSTLALNSSEKGLGAQPFTFGNTEDPNKTTEKSVSVIPNISTKQKDIFSPPKTAGATMLTSSASKLSNNVLGSTTTNPTNFRFGDPASGKKHFPELSTSVPSAVFTFNSPKSPLSNSVVPMSNPSIPQIVTSKKSENIPIPSTSNSEKTAFVFGNNSTPFNLQFNKTENKTSIVDRNINPILGLGSSLNNGKLTSAEDVSGSKPGIVNELQSRAATGNSNSSKQNTSFSDVQLKLAMNTKNSGFNFGSAVPANNQTDALNKLTSQNQFQFGVAEKPISSGGFNFSLPIKSSNPTSVTSAFDGNAKPMFNFQGGTSTTFTASPAENREAAVPLRKFKKAVRRAAQR